MHFDQPSNPLPVGFFLTQLVGSPPHLTIYEMTAHFVGGPFKPITTRVWERA